MSGLLFPLSVPQLPHLSLAAPTCSSQASFLPPPPSHAPPPPLFACSPTSVEVEEEGAGSQEQVSSLQHNPGPFPFRYRQLCLSSRGGGDSRPGV